jgi:LmbE family N-acetylglucosaminyl deacetylase
MIDRKIIVFAPHPDDETLACGGTIVKKIQEGYEVHVVVMTDGRHSLDLVLGLKEPPPEAIAKIRAKEVKEATTILGVQSDNLILLGFEDSNLKQYVAKAKERTIQILDEIRPVEVFVTYRDDDSEDHRAAYRIVKDSIKEVNLSTRLHEYPVWGGKVPSPGLKVLVMNVNKELGTKKEALSRYKSQISKCFPKQKKAVLSEDFVKSFCSDSETFYAEE